MKSPITKIAAAAVIIVAVILGLTITGGPDVASVTWAEVIEHIENAKTLTWKVTSTEEGKTTISRYMVFEPSLMRVELPDGRILITDHQKERTLILDTTNKTATAAYARPEMFDYNNYFKNILSFPGVSAVEIGSREIKNRRTIGFKIELPKGNNGTYGVFKNNEPIIDIDFILWTNAETQLPVLIEKTLFGSEGRIVHSITDEIVFDAELDKALFNLEVPSGYELQDSTEIIKRMKSAVEMNKILKACMIYDNQHEQWPDNLQELALSDIDVNKYIYLKPSGRFKDRIIVLYDVYDTWKSGINVGFNDYRVEFIEDESEFKKLLENK